MVRYEVIADHLEPLLATLAADPPAKGLPGYVTMRCLGESQDTIAEALFHQRRESAVLAEIEVHEGGTLVQPPHRLAGVCGQGAAGGPRGAPDAGPFPPCGGARTSLYPSTSLHSKILTPCTVER